MKSVFSESSIAILGSILDDNKNRKGGVNPTLYNYVGLLGFEPRQTESKSVVLPLHHNPVITISSFGLQK